MTMFSVHCDHLLLLSLTVLLLASAIGETSATRALQGGAKSSTSLNNGEACQLATNLEWQPPFCKGSVLNCVINKLPADGGKLLQGFCNSTAARGPHCSIGPYKFAVGVSGIPAYGPSNCEKCTCRLHPELPGANKARCDCDPLPACYVARSGKVVGKGCPYQLQPQCVIVKPWAGKLVKGAKTHLGKCQAPQVGYCVSAGETWGPLFYAQGTKRVPMPGNRCMACMCKAGGQIADCKKIQGCTKR